MADKRFRIVSFIKRPNIEGNTALDVIDGFKEVGQDIIGVDMEGKGVEEIRKIIIDTRPDFLFTINLVGLYPELFCELKIPFASWFTVHPWLLAKRPPPIERHYIFICDRDFAQKMRVEGYKNVEYLPLATNPKIFRRIDGGGLKEYECEVSYAGNYFRVFGNGGFDRRALDEIFTKEVVDKVIALAARSPSREITEILLNVLKGEETKPEEYLKTYINSFLENYLNLLHHAAMQQFKKEVILSLKDFGIRVYGNPGWREVEEIDFRGWIDNRRDLPRLYNASKINLNILQSQLESALNLRCFDIPACGGFMLSNFKEDLLELFDEGETVWFEDIEDLREKVRFYLKNQKERERVRERARKRVLLEHTFYHRAKRVVEVMRGFI